MRRPLFFTPPPPTELSTLSLHDALPISVPAARLVVADPEPAHLPDATAGVRQHRKQCPVTDPFRRDRRRRVEHRSEEHTSELQSLRHLVCRLLLEKKKTHHHTLQLYDRR